MHASAQLLVTVLAGTLICLTLAVVLLVLAAYGLWHTQRLPERPRITLADQAGRRELPYD